MSEAISAADAAEPLDSLFSRACAARDFFRALYAGAPSGAFLSLWDGQTKLSRHVPAEELEITAAVAVEDFCDRPSHDAYFGLALRSRDCGAMNRGKLDDLVGIPGLWVDVDVAAGRAHKAANLPPTFDAARELLQAAHPGITPSFVVHSGYGLHAYALLDRFWTFADAKDRDRAAVLVRDYQAAVIAAGAARGWHVDKTSDLPRVLRVPGSKNWKDPKAPRDVRIVEVTERIEA